MNAKTFNTSTNYLLILQNITAAHYMYYVPCISSDNLELYFKRYLKEAIAASTLFEICVAVKSTAASNFSVPKVLLSKTTANLIEAPTLTVDKSIIYYHKKLLILKQ